MSEQLRIQQVRQFLIAAESGSFRTAASETLRSQAAVSAAMRELEAQVGAKLFEANRRTTLTPLAREILPLFKELLTVHDRVLRDAKDLAQAQRGSVSIAVVPFLAEEWLPMILTEFAARFPQVKFTAVDQLSHQICAMVSEGQVDIGVAGRAPADPALRFEPVAVDSFGVLARRDHPFVKRGRPVPWSALRHERLIGNDSATVLRRAGLGDWIENPSMTVTSRMSLVECVKAGVGITVLPLLSQPTNVEGLAFVPLIRPQLPRTLGVVTRKGRTLLPAASEMRALLFDSLKTYARQRGARLVQRQRSHWRNAK